jgi:Putative inner membrane protein (DUF1819)
MTAKNDRVPTRHPETSRYRADIGGGTLMLLESRKIAALLLGGVSDADWRNAIEVENVLQKTSTAAAKRIASLIRARLETMEEDIWSIVRDGDRDVAMQAMFAASIKHSALLGDFIDVVVRGRFQGFHNTLPKTSWVEYLDICRSRAPEMPAWKDSTSKKLGEHVYRILSEVGVLADTKTYGLRKLAVRREVRENLQGHGERYVLRCLEALE